MKNLIRIKYALELLKEHKEGKWVKKDSLPSVEELKKIALKYIDYDMKKDRVKSVAINGMGKALHKRITGEE